MTDHPTTRRTFIKSTSLCGALLATSAPRLFASETDDDATEDMMTYLREITAATIEASRVRPGQSVGNMPANSTGGTLIRPGGRACYPSFWVRDFAMSLDCGLIPYEEVRHGFEVIAKAQQDETTRQFNTGATAPPYSIPDHVNFDGRAVFYPGTYSSGDDQGGGVWGVLPPIDNHYDFIHIAHHLLQKQPDTPLLETEIAGLPVLERLRKAFDVPRTDPDSQLALSEEATRAVGFGFCDAIQKTGNLLFCSLLRYRAAKELAQMCRSAGHATQAEDYLAVAEKVRVSIAEVFTDPDAVGGWLLAATQDCRQADVWGTLYALHLDVLPEPIAARARETVLDALERGTIEYLGAVRHVPTDMDASPGTAWERSAAAHNTYQNGAYWHTPTGWLIRAVRPLDAELAQRIMDDFIGHLREADFRQGPTFQAPWECLGKGGHAYQNPVYLTSVTLPLACLPG